MVFTMSDAVAIVAKKKQPSDDDISCFIDRYMQAHVTSIETYPISFNRLCLARNFSSSDIASVLKRLYTPEWVVTVSEAGDFFRIYPRDWAGFIAGIRMVTSQ